MADWKRHALWWHVYPLGFLGAPAVAGEREPVTHRLGHLCDWLDYARDLGASGLLLGPIFASTSHGYDTIDHFRVDPRLGGDDDFAALVTAARSRGLRLVLDGVFNHVGRAFPAFAEVLAQGPAAPRADWFHLHWPAGATEPDAGCFEGHHALVTLNHANPAVADYVTRVMIHWLDRGAAGWRLDAAYAMSTGFWHDVVARVRAVHPDAFLVAEMIHGDYGAWVEATHVDTVTQYELWKAIWSSLADRNLFELAWAMDRHGRFTATFPPLTFVGNHDVTRLASLIGDPRHHSHALVVLFTLAGIPCVYAGDEQGFTGIKENRTGGDDAIRPAFPATPAGLPPQGWPVYRLHQRLIGLRRRHPWLTRARAAPLHLTNRQMTYACTDSDQVMLVCLNLDDSPYVRPLEHRHVVLAAGDGVALSEQGNQITVPAHQWAILGA